MVPHTFRRGLLSLGWGRYPHESAQVFVSCSKSSNVDDEDKINEYMCQKGSMVGLISLDGGRRDRGALVLHCEDTAGYQPRRELLPGAVAAFDS